MIKETLLTGWHFSRWVRLALGVFIGIEAIQSQDTLSGFISVFFLFQSLANVGCCGTSACSVPSKKNEEAKMEDVIFEEIKIK